MLNKQLLFIVLFLSSIISNAQFITLEKMNSLEKSTIELPRKIKIIYQTDSFKLKQKVNIIDYHFPYLIVLKNKKDTLVLNVVNISSLKISTPIKNTAFVFSTFLTMNISIAAMTEVIRGKFSLLLVVIPCGFLTYESVTNFGKKYNTKTKWSFY